MAGAGAQVRHRQHGAQFLGGGGKQLVKRPSSPRPSPPRRGGIAPGVFGNTRGWIGGGATRTQNGTGRRHNSSPGSGGTDGEPSRSAMKSSRFAWRPPPAGGGGREAEQPVPHPLNGEGNKNNACDFPTGLYIWCMLRLMPWAGSPHPNGGAGGSLTY